MTPQQLLHELSTQPLAIHPESVRVLAEALHQGNADVAGRFGDPALQPVRAGQVAILPMQGVLTRLGSFGGTSTELFGRWLDEAVADASIRGILLHIDSPGGTYQGTHELADKIYQARGKKPIIAYTAGLMASGAYYAGSAADKIVAGITAAIGSIGVLTMHIDASALLSAMGLRLTFISAGKHKVDANMAEPLSNQSRETLQEGVNYVYGQFLEAAARNRGVSLEKVASDFGQGKVLYAPSALKVGMIDRIGSLESVLEELAGQKISTTSPFTQSPMSQPTSPSTAVPQTQPAPAAAPPAAPVVDQAAVTKASEDATAAERKRCAEVVALCSRAGKIDLAITAIKDGKSIELLQKDLLESMLSTNKPVGEASDKDQLQGADPDRKFKAEYQQHKDLYARQGVSEEAYCRSRRRDEGLAVEPLSQKKAAA